MKQSTNQIRHFRITLTTNGNKVPQNSSSCNRQKTELFTSPTTSQKIAWICNHFQTMKPFPTKNLARNHWLLRRSEVEKLNRCAFVNWLTCSDDGLRSFRRE